MNSKSLMVITSLIKYDIWYQIVFSVLYDMKSSKDGNASGILDSDLESDTDFFDLSARPPAKIPKKKMR